VVSRVVIQGELQDRYEVQRLLLEAHPEVHIDTVGTPWELLDRARGGEYGVALILKGPIARHQERVQAVASLKASGFAGRILYAGAFLTEKQDALQAGAHYAFDPDAQRAEEVVWAALYKPSVAVDHPYLRFLFVGEWLEQREYADILPATAPDVLLTSTSRHGVPEFYGALAEFTRRPAACSWKTRLPMTCGLRPWPPACSPTWCCATTGCWRWRAWSATLPRSAGSPVSSPA
jgi:hypothetical protein